MSGNDIQQGSLIRSLKNFNERSNMKLKLSNNESDGNAQNALEREVRGRNDNLKAVIDSSEICRFWSDYLHVLTGSQIIKKLLLLR